MKKARVLMFVLILAPFAAPLLASASDTAKEKRWADQIVDTLIDGDAVWLEAGKTKFLGIYTESATKPAKGAVIVAHGIGVHPDWADVVNPLRVKLTQHGWSTLSLQMPILANEAEYKDYFPLFVEIAPRMQVALEFLKSKGHTTIALVGHSLGATMAAYYMAHNPNPLKGLVAVGVSGTQLNDPGYRYFDTLPKIKVPILDIYGSKDIEPVLASVAQRADIAKKSGHVRYTQVVVKDGNHFFQGKDEAMVKEINAWLGKNVAR